MEYVVTSFLGLFKRLVYQCPSCTHELRSRINEAGTTDTCPMCGVQFVVPGGEHKLRQQAAEQERIRAEEERKAEEAKCKADSMERAMEAVRKQRAAEAIAIHFADEAGAAAVGHIPGPGDFAIEVVGESHYQDAIQAAIRTRRKVRCVVMADLILEDSNPHDPRAVQIQINGRICGYLDRQNAREYRRRLREADLPDETFSCEAAIVGDGPFGVRLDLPHDGSEPPYGGWRSEPATDRQRAFADDLGLAYPEDITKGELSDLIGEAMDD